MSRRREFTTRPEAETRIAELGLVGLKKPRRVGSKWFMVDNPTQTVSKSQFIQALFVKHSRNKTGYTPREIMRQARALWNEILGELI